MEPRSDVNELDPRAEIERVARGADDPLARLIERWWREIVLVAAVCGALFYGFRAFQDTQLQRQRDSADLFASVAQGYRALLSAQTLRLTAEREAEQNKAKAQESKQDSAQKAIDQSATKLAEATKNLEQSSERLQQAISALRDARQPYSELAGLYAALRWQALGEADKAAGELVSVRESTTLDPLLRDLARLVDAKRRLDNPAELSQARKDLEQLLSVGSPVAVPAAMTLAALASDAESKKHVAALINGLQTRFPEYGDALKGSLAMVQLK